MTNRQVLSTMVALSAGTCVILGLANHDVGYVVLLALQLITLWFLLGIRSDGERSER